VVEILLAHGRRFVAETMARTAIVAGLLAILVACGSDPESVSSVPSPGPGSVTGSWANCIDIPQAHDWEYVGTAFESGIEGEFDRYLWGGFGGSTIRLDDEILLYYQGARGFSEVQQSVIFRSIGLAVSADGTTFTKDTVSPVLEWTPKAGEEEGAASVAVAVGPGGEIVAFYGANTMSGATTVNADGRWATSADGRDFTDRGIVLDHGDRDVFGSGDELFPVIALFHGQTWYVYYLPNGEIRGRLGVAFGRSPDALDENASVRMGKRQVLAWGMASAAQLCGDIYALFLNDVESKTMTVHLVDLNNPEALSDPVATYRFSPTDRMPGFSQGAVHLDRETGYWYLYYRVDDASRYAVRRAPLVMR
jgi:hypothetical protein